MDMSLVYYFFLKHGVCRQCGQAIICSHARPYLRYDDITYIMSGAATIACDAAACIAGISWQKSMTLYTGW